MIKKLFSILGHLKNYLIVLISATFIAISFASISQAKEEKERVMPTIDEAGLHVHDWFLNSFMDLKEDLADSTDQGKKFVVFIEQKGCIYCTKMHEQVLSLKYIQDYVKDRYNVLQLNLWGDREVTDFDGEVLTEKKLAKKWNVVFTPTILFFHETKQDSGGDNSGLAGYEITRMPGAFGAHSFEDIFKWIGDDIYLKEPDFQRYHIDMLNARRADGTLKD